MFIYFAPDWSETRCLMRVVITLEADLDWLACAAGTILGIFLGIVYLLQQRHTSRKTFTSTVD